MNAFNTGWWICFLSYTDTISFRIDAQGLAFEQMSSAGIEVGEIDHIIASKTTMTEATKGILVAYKKLKTKKSEV